MKYYAHHTLFFWGEGIVIKRNHNYLYQYLLILIPCLYLYIKWVKSRLRNFSKFSRFLWGITLFSHFSREIDVIKTDQMLSNYLQSGKLDKRLCNFHYDWTDHDKARKIWLPKLRNINPMDNAVRKLDLVLKNVLFKYVSQWNSIGGVSCNLYCNVFYKFSGLIL